MIASKMNPVLSCVVMGSFKYKSSIDQVIRELKGNGVKVLGPDEGGLYRYDKELTGMQISAQSTLEFFPLLSERKMTPWQVEVDFLRKAAVSDFAYLVNPGGYVGNMVSLEIGFCMGRKIPLYCLEPINPGLDIDPAWRERISWIEAQTVTNTVKIESERKSKGPEIILPTPKEVELLSSQLAYKAERKY